MISGIALGCDYQGRHFGASYPDAQCVDGFLWDEDSCDEPGGALRHGGDIPCPKCNWAAHASYFATDEAGLAPALGQNDRQGALRLISSHVCRWTVNHSIPSDPMKEMTL